MKDNLTKIDLIPALKDAISKCDVETNVLKGKVIAYNEIIKLIDDEHLEIYQRKEDDKEDK